MWLFCQIRVILKDLEEQKMGRSVYLFKFFKGRVGEGVKNFMRLREVQDLQERQKRST